MSKFIPALLFLQLELNVQTDIQRLSSANYFHEHEDTPDQKQNGSPVGGSSALSADQLEGHGRPAGQAIAARPGRHRNHSARQGQYFAPMFVS